MKIEFFSGILPSEILGGNKKLNHNSVIGLTLTFLSYESSGLIREQLPITGFVKRRFAQKGFSGWFEVELETSLHTEKSETKTIFIRANNSNELISTEEETSVGIFIQEEQDEKRNLVFFDWAIVK